MTTPDFSTSSIVPERSSPPPGAVTEQPLSVPSSATDATLAPLPGALGDGPDRPYRGLDFALSGVVLLFAFLAASFVETNSDLWRHLATGRLLAHREYHFGVDPFAYTTKGVYWANPSWLYDGLLYLLYSATGGAGLVLFKALLVTVLAWALLGVRRWSGDVSVPAACTALAVLAMRPSLELRPAVLSYLFLGLTLWLLWRHRTAPSPQRQQGTTFGQQLRQFAPLLLLFALWANLDEWFLLGPAVVALVCLGQLLQRLLPGGSGGVGEKTVSVSSASPLPFWLVPASLAVCLLNPHHVHIFALPAELSPVLSAAGLAQDARFQGLFTPAWRLNLHVRPVAAINLAEWSYVVLVVLGLVSFILNWRHLSGGRLLVWLAFAGLSAWRLRTVPFFAVVAGPIAALELQNFLARRAAGRPVRQASKRFVTGRVAVLTVGLALVVLTWAGWLQGFYREERRPAWAVQPDPSLQRVAETIQRLRDEGKLTANDRAFPFHPDVANYLAWFCPGEMVFLDGRLTLFGRVLPEYVRVCRQLAPDVDLREAEGMRFVDIETDWRTVFRDRGITYLILHDPDPELFHGTMKRLAENSQWVLLHVDGQALPFGWRDARVGAAARNFTSLAFDANRLVYGPPNDWDLPPAPEQGPGRDPQVRPFWAHQGRPGPAPVWESAAAETFLRFFEDRARAYGRQAVRRAALADLASLVLRPALPASPQAGLADVASLVLEPAGRAGSAARESSGGWWQLFGDPRSRPPALPLLAVRAARRAVAANPDDANAYLQLGKAYRMLTTRTFEGKLGAELAPLVILRHVQAVSALERALLRDPDLLEAHEILAVLYAERGYLDASLAHLRHQLRLRRSAPPTAREEAKDRASRLAQLEKGLEQLEKQVQDAQNRFLTQSQPTDDPHTQARRALSLGLARQALDDILLQSPGQLLGPGGVKLQLELLLQLGRLGRAREDLADAAKLKGELGATFQYLSVYEWLLICAASANGDYDQADDMLREILLALDGEGRPGMQTIQKNLPKTVANEFMLRAAPEALSLHAYWQRERQRETRLLQQALALRALEADLYVVLGALDLERGQSSSAKESLERALALSQQFGGEVDYAGRHLALYYLGNIKDAQKERAAEGRPRQRARAGRGGGDP